MTTSRFSRSRRASFSGLSPTTRARLAAHGISSLGELCDCTWLELHSLPGCGLKTTSECDELLKARELIYKVKEPEEAFGGLSEALAVQYAETGDFKALGERYGLSGALMYEVYSALERSAKAYERSKQANFRWQTQSVEDDI